MKQGKMTLPTGVTVRDPVGDHYVVKSVLNKEQTGAVYLVRQKSGTQAHFSLKEIITPTEREHRHFLFEGQILMQLSHPALPRVYRIFEHDSLKRVYLLMDYIQGKNLEVLRQQSQRLPLPLVLTLLSPIADALTYLHQQEPPVLHRNVKPSNIIISNEAQQAILVDFGMAKLFSTGTTTGFFQGTLGYAAPEQYMGKTTPRTDVYGLAATLYALLTGSVPPSAVSRLRSLNSDPLKPVAQLAPDLPLEVTHALERALSIDTEHRYSTIEAFWHDMTTDAALSSERTPLLLTTPQPFIKKQEPESVLAPSRPSQPPPLHNRRYNLFLLIAFALLLILILGIMILLRT